MNIRNFAILQFWKGNIYGSLKRFGLFLFFCMFFIHFVFALFFCICRSAQDYSTFVSQLFAHEADDGADSKYIERIDYDNKKVQPKSALDNDERKMYRDGDATYIEWLGDDRKYCIKTTEGFKDRNNASLIRGYCSNTVSRWVGYRRANDSPWTYDAIFAPSQDIGVDALLNAMFFALESDYVMPFAAKFEHEIWEWTLRDLWDFGPKRRRRRLRRNLVSPKQQEVINRRARDRTKRDLRRPSVRKRSQRNAAEVSRTEWEHDHVSKDEHRVSSTNVMDSWSQKEKSFIKSMNLLDYQLYAMAIRIADADVLFYKSQK